MVIYISDAHLGVQHVFDMQKIEGRFEKDMSFEIITTKVEYHEDFRALLSHWEDGQHAAEHRKIKEQKQNKDHTKIGRQRKRERQKMWMQMQQI